VEEYEEVEMTDTTTRGAGPAARAPHAGDAGAAPAPRRRNAGTAILLISTELDEVLALSDRILVLYEGRIAGERRAGEANAEELGLMMGGRHEAPVHAA
jgi:hypothetical protein